MNKNWIIEVDITHRCNLKCRHCNRLCNEEKDYFTQRDCLFMREAHIDYLCSQIKKYPIGKVKMIRILGGEPLLSPIIHYAIEKFNTLKVENVINEICIMSNGTITVPEDLKQYIINYPPKVKELFAKKGKLMASEVYEAKEEKHLNITVSPSDFDELVDNICDRYIGCGIHYTVYGFSLTAPCFPSIFVFPENHKYFRRDLPPTVKDFCDANFLKSVCSRCVYGLKTRDTMEEKLYDSSYMGGQWAKQIRKNALLGFREPDINWINEI